MVSIRRSSGRSGSRATVSATAAVLAALATTALGATHAGSDFTPDDGKLFFGSWFDAANQYHDSPAKFNQRLGQLTPIFQIAQDIPLLAYNYTTGAGGPALENQIELSNSTAAVFLTVYPYLGFDAVTAQDYTDLGNQILGYETQYNRTTFLRYAPEMQGLWNKYGQQPTAFIQSFQTMYTTVKAIAPNCKIVWAPNTPQGYPYGQGGDEFTSLSTADQTALDTSGDGALTAADDSLSPYWPGPDYVDWIGISLYYKGPSGGDTTNQVQDNGYCHLAINGTNPQTGVAISNWYTDYCAMYPTKPCMFAESGAAYHLTNPAGDSQLDIQTAWINDCVTNTTMFETFPQLQMIMQFEYEKEESANDGSIDLRDYRITNATDVLSVFQSALSTASGYWEWAASQTQASSISSVGQQAPQTNSNGETITNAITATTRGRPTTFPSLFGLSSAASQMTEIVELSVLVASGVAGALAVMRYL